MEIPEIFDFFNAPPETRELYTKAYNELANQHPHVAIPQNLIRERMQEITSRNDTSRHTPNGYDPRWVEAINEVMNSRQSPVRITDITEEAWDEFIGPLCDMIEEEEEGTATYVEARPCAKCGTSKPQNEMLRDEGTGAEQGREFYYCSQDCLESH